MPPPGHYAKQEVQHARDPWATFRRLLGLLAGRRRAVAMLLPPLLLATVGGVPVRLVVDEQSDMPVRLEADLTEAMAGIVPGIVQQVMDRFGPPGEGMAITVSKLAVSTALSDFDEAVVTLPADIAA